MFRESRFYYQKDMVSPSNDSIFPKGADFCCLGERIFRSVKKLLHSSQELEAYVSREAEEWRPQGGKLIAFFVKRDQRTYPNTRNGSRSNPLSAERHIVHLRERYLLPRQLFITDLRPTLVVEFVIVADGGFDFFKGFILGYQFFYLRTPSFCVGDSLLDICFGLDVAVARDEGVGIEGDDSFRGG